MGDIRDPFIAQCIAAQMPTPYHACNMRLVCRAWHDVIPQCPRVTPRAMVMIAARAGMRELCAEACERGVEDLARYMDASVTDEIRAEWIHSWRRDAIREAARGGHDDIVEMLCVFSAREGGFRSKNANIHAWIEGALIGGHRAKVAELRAKFAIDENEFMYKCSFGIGASGDIALILDTFAKTCDSVFNGSRERLINGVFDRNIPAVIDAVMSNQEIIARNLATIRHASFNYGNVAVLQQTIKLSVAFGDRQEWHWSLIPESRNISTSLKRELCELMFTISRGAAFHLMAQHAAGLGDIEMFQWSFRSMTQKNRAPCLTLSLTDATYAGHRGMCNVLRELGACLGDSGIRYGLEALDTDAYFMIPDILKWNAEDGSAIHPRESCGDTCIGRAFAAQIAKFERSSAH